MGLLDSINTPELIETTKEKIKKIYLQDNMPWIIGYSGGKDSTCTTQIIIDSLLDLNEAQIPLTKKVYIISSDTMVETPMIIDTINTTIKNINTLATRYDLPISASIVRPLVSRGFWANLIGRGYPCPNQSFRWCTDRMKIEPSNRFTQSLIEEYGEVVMVLGVREGESNSRDRVLDNHTIYGKDFMRHTTQANSYVFAPIRNFTKDDVWNYLLTHKSPWGSDNNALFKLYQDSLTGEECPIMMTEEDKKKTTCGNSRFGCWVCTVVSEDKSLTGFIKSGVTWLKPLLDYRNWLVSIRDNDEMRMKRRLNGTIYFSRVQKISDDEILISAKGAREKNIIKNINNLWLDSQGIEWHVFTSDDSEMEARDYISKSNIDLTLGNNPKIIIKKLDGEFYQLGLGPFTLEARKEMLKKLLETQSKLEVKHELISSQELIEIQKIWFECGDISQSVNDIYRQVFSSEIEIETDDVKLFEESDYSELEDLCKTNNFDYSLFNDLINIEKKYIGYTKRNEVLRIIKEKLSQEFLSVNDEELPDED